MEQLHDFALRIWEYDYVILKKDRPFGLYLPCSVVCQAMSERCSEFTRGQLPARDADLTHAISHGKWQGSPGVLSIDSVNEVYIKASP